MISNSELIMQLDQTLNWLSERNKLYSEHNDVKTFVFNNSSDIDVEAILIKLRNDGMIHYGLLGSATHFKISIEGYDLIRRGGYKWKYEQDARISELKEAQISSAIHANKSSISVNESTTKLNEDVLPENFKFQKKFGSRSIWLAFLSALFIFVTVIQQATDTTGKELRLLRQSLQQQSLELQKIQSSLQQINTSIRNNENDSVHVP